MLFLILFQTFSDLDPDLMLPLPQLLPQISVVPQLLNLLMTFHKSPLPLDPPPTSVDSHLLPKKPFPDSRLLSEAEAPTPRLTLDFQEFQESHFSQEESRETLKDKLTSSAWSDQSQSVSPTELPFPSFCHQRDSRLLPTTSLTLSSQKPQLSTSPSSWEDGSKESTPQEPLSKDALFTIVRAEIHFSSQKCTFRWRTHPQR